MKKAVFSLIIACFALYAAFAQDTAQDATAAAPQPRDNALTADERLRLAISSIEYPVTPGDVYRLNYRQSASSYINQEVLIDGVGVIDLGVFGKIDASGMTFFQLKQKVEDLIAKNYTFSLPNLSIITPGVFRVCVRDGASRIQYRMAWGLTRLSEIVADFHNGSTSLRNVELIPLNKEPKMYDLLKAAFSNESGLDPLVRPGDTVMLHTPGKTVRLQGEVRRPGLYELMRGEGLKALIETYGGGLSNEAEATRVRIDRTVGNRERSDYVSLPGAYMSEVALNDGDMVVIRSRVDQLPLVWFEGAVSGSAILTSGEIARGATSNDGSAANAGRFSYPIREGQMMSDILQDVRAAMLPGADIASATLYVPGSQKGTPINIHGLISGSDMSSDVALSDGYRIVIPVIANTILVSGAVYSPGNVSYKPNASARYYMTLAGGADPSRNAFNAYEHYDQDGKPVKASAPIMPGDRIHVKSNSIVYGLGQAIPLLSSILSFATLAVTMILTYWP
jgi:protein involved in polysaccharide export with SLBB domain